MFFWEVGMCVCVSVVQHVQSKGEMFSFPTKKSCYIHTQWREARQPLSQVSAVLMEPCSSGSLFVFGWRKTFPCKNSWTLMDCSLGERLRPAPIGIHYFFKHLLFFFCLVSVSINPTLNGDCILVARLVWSQKRRSQPLFWAFAEIFLFLSFQIFWIGQMLPDTPGLFLWWID